MKQPVKKNKTVNKKIVVKKTSSKKYGTSELEKHFAHNFLEPLGVKYIYEYFASQIGRYYDFAILIGDSKNLQFEEKDGLKSVKQEKQYTPGSMILLEIDGSYYHSDPRVVDENKLSPMQKKNKRVDEHKDEWALMHGIPIMRIWEYDIRNNPSGVMKTLKDRLYIENNVQIKLNNKNKRHRNILK